MARRVLHCQYTNSSSACPDLLGCQSGTRSKYMTNFLQEYYRQNFGFLFDPLGFLKSLTIGNVDYCPTCSAFVGRCLHSLTYSSGFTFRTLARNVPAKPRPVPTQPITVPSGEVETAGEDIPGLPQECSQSECACGESPDNCSACERPSEQEAIKIFYTTRSGTAESFAKTLLDLLQKQSYDAQVRSPHI